MAMHTPLYEEHVALAAKMADFAGWDMPLYYGSQIEEHNCVRQDAGVFDVSHMNIVDVKGKKARDFLRYLFANDVDKLKEQGKALYSCMLNERAGVIDDLIVYRYAPTDYYRVVVNAATRDKDLAWIRKQAASFGIEIIEHTDMAMVAVQGPKAREKMSKVFSAVVNAKAQALKVFYGVQAEDFWVARTGYTGEDGYEIMLPKAKAVPFWRAILAAGIAPIGLVARDSLRLEAGMSLYGSEMNEDISPLEAALEWTVAWEPKERDFIGRKVLEAQKAKGVTRHLVGLVLTERGILRSHQKVVAEGIGEGETTSGGFSPTLNGAVALARVPVGLKIGMQCKVLIRDKLLSAKVTKPQFVRNGKSVVSG